MVEFSRFILSLIDTILCDKIILFKPMWSFSH